MPTVADLMIFVLLTINPETGDMTIGARPMTERGCAARLEELRQHAPPRVIGFCTMPGQTYTFKALRAEG